MLIHSDGCPVIDQKSNHDLLNLDGSNPEQGRGRVPRDYKEQPFGSLPFAKPVQNKPIPRSEWKERVRELISKKTVLSEMARKAGVKTKNQANTNFCWANAPTLCVEIMRVQAGEEYVELSPAAIACPVNNYRNVGNWAPRAIEHYAKFGGVPVSMWPANAIDRRYDNAETQSMRPRHRVTDWLDLPQNSFDHLFSENLRLRPVAIGVDAWGHEITACDPVVTKDGRFGVRIWNSWSDDWGQRGMGILTEDYLSSGFDQIAPLSSTAL